MIATIVSLGFDGIAFGVVLYLITCGLSITMGLMNLPNMAHASFAMFGGYFTLELMRVGDVPFLLALPITFIAGLIAGAVMERLFFSLLYQESELNQVLFTIGIVFMAIGAATFFWGTWQQPLKMPPYLSGAIEIGRVAISVYRAFIIVVGGLVVAAMIVAIDGTLWGAKIRAAVDNRRMTASCGVNVAMLFTTAFSIGTGLAALGGALSMNLVGIDPFFPLKYLVYTLIVVVVGGLGSIKGALAASLLLGIGDIFVKYYYPVAGSFFIYVLAAALLIARPQGLFGRPA
jgi:branched-chain amino acid transport system permease protein